MGVMRVVNHGEVNDFFENIMVYLENCIVNTDNITKELEELQNDEYTKGGIQNDISNCLNANQNIRYLALGAIDYLYTFSSEFNVRWNADISSIRAEIEELKEMIESYSVLGTIFKDNSYFSVDNYSLEEIGIEIPEGFKLYQTELGTNPTADDLYKSIYGKDYSNQKSDAINVLTTFLKVDAAKLGSKSVIPVVGVLSYDISENGENWEFIRENFGLSKAQVKSFSRKLGLDPDKQIAIPTFQSGKKDIQDMFNPETIKANLNPIQNGDLKSSGVENEFIEYKIEKGDTLSRIADEFGVTSETKGMGDTEYLQKYNDITDPAKLKIGDTIKIPIQEEGETNE